LKPRELAESVRAAAQKILAGWKSV
jgi:hypothetical protein